VIKTRRFDPAGVPLADEEQLSGPHPKARLSRPPLSKHPSIGCDDDGGCIVSWGTVLRRNGYMSFVRRLAPGGGFMGSDFALGADTRFEDYPPTIAMEPSGRFVATWDALDHDAKITRYQDVYGALFSPAGQRLGRIFRLNSDRDAEQLAPTAALLSPWKFVVTWTRYVLHKTGNETYPYNAVHYDVYMRRFAASSSPTRRPDERGSSRRP
jgi:hypothetical protein